MTAFILSFAGITLTMSCVTAVLLISEKLCGARFTHACRYIVWSLVILRLCIPFTGLNAFSFFEVKIPLDKQLSLPAAVQVVTKETDEKPGSDADIKQNITDENNIPQNNAPSFIPDVMPNTSNGAVNDPVYEIKAEEIPNTVPNANGTADFKETAGGPARQAEGIPLKTVLNAVCTVWMSVAALYFSANIGIHTLYSAHLLKNKKAPSVTAKQVYAYVGSKYKIKKLPRLYVVSGIPGPMLAGYFRPVVMIPDRNFNQGQLESIFNHELTHYRRHDLWTKLLCLLGVSLQWFNPLAYIAAKHCNNEMELSCDELVLKDSCRELRRDYGMTMLEIAKNGYNRAGGLTTMFNPKKKTLKDRLMNIMDMTKKRAGRRIIGVVTVVCVIAGMVIGGAAVDAGEDTVSDLQSEDIRAAEFDKAWSSLNADGKATEQCYDFFYNMLSGKSLYKEYNELGITDWSLKRIDGNGDYFAAFEFEFTVTGDISETLPKGTYKKYVHDIRETLMYDDREMTIFYGTDHIDSVYGEFVSNEAAKITVDYILSAYHWELVSFGKWNGYLPVNYIVNRYGKDGKMPFDEFKEAAEKYVGAVPDDFKSINIEDGSVYAGGVGGAAEFTVKSIEEKYGVYYVTVQFYGDFNRILPSHTVTYRVGENGYLYGMDMIKRAEYEPVGLSKYTTDKPTEVYDIEDCEALGLSKSDSRYTLAKSFLAHEVEPFVAGYRYPDMFDELKELEFGKYSIKRDILTGEYSLKVEITKGNGRFKESTYNFGFLELLGGLKVSEPNKAALSDCAKQLMNFIDCTGMYDFDSSSLNNPRFAEYIINQLGGVTTLRELSAYAENKFPFIKGYAGIFYDAGLIYIFDDGSDEYRSYDTYDELESQTLRVPGHGGLIIPYTVTDEYEKDGETVVRVQFYADAGKLVKSHLIDYRMIKEGDGWALSGVDRVETGKYEPFIYMV